MADESTASDHHTSQIDEFPLQSDGDGLVSVSIPTQTGVQASREGKEGQQERGVSNVKSRAVPPVVVRDEVPSDHIDHTPLLAQGIWGDC
jgi:hypothetical protein